MKFSSAAIGVFTFIVTNASQAADAPAAPVPGSPGTYVEHSTTAAALQSAMTAGKDPAVSPMAITDQYLVNQVHRSKVSPPAVHPGWTELHLVLEGSATFVTGGRIVEKTAGQKSISGGVSRQVKAGDAIVVPPNTPHWYSQIDGGVTVIEVRFIAPAAKEPAK